MGLVAVGTLAGVGGVVFSDAREVLLSLAATGLFGAVLAIVLSSDRVLPDTVAENVYASSATNGAALVDALELSDRRIYVPANGKVLLSVPAEGDQSVPTDPTVPWSSAETDTTDLVFEPSGSGLYRDVNRTLPGDLDPEVETTAKALTDGLVDVLEIADEAVADVVPSEGKATVGVAGSAFGDVDRFDHPIASYLAVGFASRLGRPVTLEVRSASGSADWEITCSWDSVE
ncbi:hypothetical protein [Natronorubrum bangense]|uniref:DUF7982 domain-containing protein n=1 Tax=Natronorubrum bangense TaxID=61858 RepID=A0A4D6HSN0_9EURY|nr:hypothetical protein [Natronorubrum bangense]QCC56266.1 hypothetical protein DV706_17055 [Natronorubrum bangense]